MAGPPAVNVLLAVYNGERHLERSARSILNQSFADLELIVVNDGSTDGTAEILASLRHADSRVTVVSQENVGLTKSLNRGLGFARGTYIARQDADDVSLPDRLGRQIAYLEGNPSVAAVGTSADVIDRSGTVIARLTAACGTAAVRRGLLAMSTTPVHGSMMIRRLAIEAIGGYRDAFRVAQDYDLWLRLIARYDVHNLPEVLYQWRLDSDGVYATRRAVQLKYAGLARAFAEERLRDGRDSYEDFKRNAGDLDGFVENYQLGGFVLATWGELELRGLGNSQTVRQHLRRALLRGHIRPWTLCLAGWTHLGLPWPGGKPLRSPVAGTGSRTRREESGAAR